MQVNLLAFMRVYDAFICFCLRSARAMVVFLSSAGLSRGLDSAGLYSPLDAGSCLGAALGPPLETPTIAGRNTRSPIVQPLWTTWETVPEGTVSSGASKIAW